MSLKDLSPDLRPREKAAGRGLSSLSEAELLAILLSSGGSSGRSALDLAQALLSRYGSLFGLSKATLPDLLLVKGVGKAKALSILSAFEMGKRAALEALKAPTFSPFQAYSLIREGVSGGESERLYLLRYDEGRCFLGYEEIASGPSRVVEHRVGPLLAKVLRSGASAFALAHNHPSGELRPSKEDFFAAGLLLSRSKEMGLLFLDNLIVGKDGYYSFSERGLLGT